MYVIGPPTSLLGHAEFLDFGSSPQCPNQWALTPLLDFRMKDLALDFL